jgi:hypothetical protein
LVAFLFDYDTPGQITPNYSVNLNPPPPPQREAFFIDENVV